MRSVILRFFCAFIVCAAFAAPSLSHAKKGTPAPAAAWPGPVADLALVTADGTGIVVIDARPPAEYAGAHIPEAINLDVTLTFDRRPGHEKMMAPVAELEKLLGEAGISPESSIIIYGNDSDYRPAARLFWVLERLGHERVAVLDGGYQAWMMSGGEPGVEPSILPATMYRSTPKAERAASKGDVKAAIDRADIALIDARSTEDYAGTSGPADLPRRGHIPTAESSPISQTFEVRGKVTYLSPPAALRENYDDAIGDAKQVVTYCNSGRAASVAYLELRSLGVNVSLYDGSWSEWSTDESLPTVEGVTPDAPEPVPEVP